MKISGNFILYFSKCILQLRELFIVNTYTQIKCIIQLSSLTFQPSTLGISPTGSAWLIAKNFPQPF